MEHFIALMASVYNMFKIPLNIYGFHFSLWDVMIFGLVISVVIGFVGRMIHDE